MSALDGVLREVAEALGAAGLSGWCVGGGATLDLEVMAGPAEISAEDVLQALPEHLWERVSVTRVAPGRFVVEEVRSGPDCLAGGGSGSTPEGGRL